MITVAVFKPEAARARLDAENAERDARLLAGRQRWLADQIQSYMDTYGRNTLDDVDLPGLLQELGMDPSAFDEDNDG